MRQPFSKRLFYRVTSPDAKSGKIEGKIPGAVVAGVRCTRWPLNLHGNLGTM